MSDKQRIANHWGSGDVLGRIRAAMAAAGLNEATLTVEQLAPVDHFHARGFPATVDLADALPVRAGDRLLDIGSGLGGPARYFAQRFGCQVDGIDITGPFVEAANALTKMVGLSEQVACVQGDGGALPFADASFDGVYSQHVTMNIADRSGFFAEAFRVLRPSGFLGLTEHGLGPEGDPVYPLPWSDDGSGAFLVPPSETVALLSAAGFERIEVTDTGGKYLAGYRRAIALAEAGELPAFGTHILLGDSAPAKTRNAAENIAEGRTHPVQVVCFRPG